ncbi:MAG: polyketide cyclase [Sideroxydans sp.]|nr:polyketide cyclase [Sideroxydans sp.]
MEIKTAPIATTALLIRKPVAEVFEAFVNPAFTSKFWFTQGSDRLQVGKQIRWDWTMFNHSELITVKAIEENKRILIEWDSYGTLTLVEWAFSARPDNSTWVSIVNAGFAGSGDEIVQQAADTMEGFVLVLAGAKAYLEHNLQLNLIADRFPDAH